MEAEDEADNIRIYIPMDLNKNAILRRLDGMINFYGEANEKNEMFPFELMDELRGEYL